MGGGTELERLRHGILLYSTIHLSVTSVKSEKDNLRHLPNIARCIKCKIAVNFRLISSKTFCFNSF